MVCSGHARSEASCLDRIVDQGRTRETYQLETEAFTCASNPVLTPVLIGSLAICWVVGGPEVIQVLGVYACE